MDIKPPDTFHLSASVGWLELGNSLEANEELEKITPKMQTHPAVLAVRLELYTRTKKWEEADDVARALVEMVPTDPGNWISHAYATRRKPNGGVAEAKIILEKAALVFPTEPIIFFNLACYESQLENFPAAKQWIDKAIQVGDKDALQKMIMEDSDLDPLRKHYGW